MGYQRRVHGGVDKRTESRSVVEKWRQELTSKICPLREVMPQSISNEFQPEKSSVENGFLLVWSAGILLGLLTIARFGDHNLNNRKLKPMDFDWPCSLCCLQSVIVHSSKK